MLQANRIFPTMAGLIYRGNVSPGPSIILSTTHLKLGVRSIIHLASLFGETPAGQTASERLQELLNEAAVSGNNRRIQELLICLHRGSGLWYNLEQVLYNAASRGHKETVEITMKKALDAPSFGPNAIRRIYSPEYFGFLTIAAQLPDQGIIDAILQHYPKYQKDLPLEVDSPEYKKLYQTAEDSNSPMQEFLRNLHISSEATTSDTWTNKISRPPRKMEL